MRKRKAILGSEGGGFEAEAEAVWMMTLEAEMEARRKRARSSSSSGMETMRGRLRGGRMRGASRDKSGIDRSRAKVRTNLVENMATTKGKASSPIKMGSFGRHSPSLAERPKMRRKVHLIAGTAAPVAELMAAQRLERLGLSERRGEEGRGEERRRECACGGGGRMGSRKKKRWRLRRWIVFLFFRYFF